MAIIVGGKPNSICLSPFQIREWRFRQSDDFGAIFSPTAVVCVNGHVRCFLLRSLRGARCIYEKFSYHEQNFEVHLWECRPSRKFEMHLREYLPSRNCHKNLNLLRNSVNQSKKILYSLGVLSAGERYEFWFHANLWGYLDDAASPPFPPSPTRSKCQL